MNTQNPFLTYMDRIVNGEEGVTVPWHIYIQREKDKPGTASICGGTMINTKLILTARHCFGGHNKDKKIKGNKLGKAFVVAGLPSNLTLLEGNT